MLLPILLFSLAGVDFDGMPLKLAFVFAALAIIIILVVLASIHYVISGNPILIRPVVRSIVLITCWPFIHFVIFFHCLIPIKAVFPVALFVMILGGNSGGLDWQFFFLAIAVIVAPLLLYHLFVAVYTISVSPLIEVIGDIFRYIGDPSYQNVLRSGLTATIMSTKDRKNKRLVLLTHSLGTVVAVDALINDPESFRDFRSITVITMGSPLKRFFSAWFPKIYTEPAEALDFLRRRYNQFSWLNIYRPADIVGRDLGLPSTEYSREINTNQKYAWYRVFKPHLDYFGDAKVYDLIKQAIVRIDHQGDQSSQRNRDHNMHAVTFGLARKDSALRARNRVALTITSTLFIALYVRELIDVKEPPVFYIGVPLIYLVINWKGINRYVRHLYGLISPSINTDELWKFGLASIKTGDYGRGAKYFAHALRLEPQSTEEILYRASDMLDVGHNELAKTDFQRAFNNLIKQEGSEKPDIINCLRGLIQSCKACSEIEEAANYERFLEHLCRDDLNSS